MRITHYCASVNTGGTARLSGEGLRIGQTSVDGSASRFRQGQRHLSSITTVSALLPGTYSVSKSSRSGNSICCSGAVRSRPPKVNGSY